MQELRALCDLCNIHVISIDASELKESVIYDTKTKVMIINNAHVTDKAIKAAIIFLQEREGIPA